jgi:uncharacterized membrane protein YeaQ/YmgE (transglycosylase-associated protein family)
MVAGLPLADCRPASQAGDMVVIDTHGIIILLVVGLVAGWLAGKLVRGAGFGIIVDILLGIVGAFVGTWLLGAMGIVIGGGIIANIVNATIGAVVLLLVVSLVRRV